MPDALAILREHINALRRYADALTMQLPPEDRLITATEAAELLACKLAIVRRFVMPVVQGKWRRSDVLRYIED